MNYAKLARIPLSTRGVYCHGEGLQRGRHVAAVITEFYEFKGEMYPSQFREATPEEKSEYCKDCK